MIADTILLHLEKVRSTGKNTWIACCCCHDDKTPSLSPLRGEDVDRLKLTDKRIATAMIAGGLR